MARISANSIILNSVDQYGAVGDAMTNDLAAFTAGDSAGAPVEFRPGASYAVGSALAMPTSKIVAGVATVLPASGFSTNNLVTLTSGNHVTGLTFSGTGMPPPGTAWNGVGIPVGCCFYGSGSLSTYLTDIKIGSVALNGFPSGGLAGAARRSEPHSPRD